MFNFLSGMKGKFGGFGGGDQQGGGFMGRMRENFKRPQMQQAAGAIGAQMMGFDPALGMGAVQGMQNRRLQQGFDSAIQPIQRQALPMPKIDPRELMLGRMPLPQQAQAPMGAQGLGGGAWQDPRLRALSLGRSSGPFY